MGVLKQIQQKCKDCASFHGSNGCYFESICRYFRDEIKRCSWFETAVLPTDRELETRYKTELGAFK